MAKINKKPNKRKLSRSEIMSRVRGKNTSPEIFVRKILCGLEFSKYRLHKKELPGKPDICFAGKKKIILVNGCFWHGHSCSHGRRRPITNVDYWNAKILGNKRRDILNTARLKSLGWSVLTLWECQLKDLKKTRAKISDFME